MLYYPTGTLAAVEHDRLWTAARHRLLAKARRERAALAREERRGPRWQVFRVSSTTVSAN